MKAKGLKSFYTVPCNVEIKESFTMSKEMKETSRFLGWLAGGLLLLAIINAFIIKPVINKAIAPISTQIRQLDEKVTNHLNLDHRNQPITPTNQE